MMSSEQFRAWRKALGWKQKEAAERLGLKKRMIQYYEKGNRDGKDVRIPKTVRLACYALSVGVDDFDGTEPAPLDSAPDATAAGGEGKGAKQRKAAGRKGGSAKPRKDGASARTEGPAAAARNDADATSAPKGADAPPARKAEGAAPAVGEGAAAAAAGTREPAPAEKGATEPAG